MKMLLNLPLPMHSLKHPILLGMFLCILFVVQSCASSLELSSWIEPENKQEAGGRLEKLQTSPLQDAANLAEKARLYFWLGRLEEAKKTVKLALHEQPQNAEYRLLAGRIEMQRKDYFQAIQQLKASLVLDANLLEGHYFLGLAYQKIGESTKAKAALENAVEMEPLYFGAQIALARLLLEEQQGQAYSRKGLLKIAGQLEKTLRIKPDSGEGHLLLSKVYQAQGASLKASLILQEWLKTHPMEDGIALQLARLELKQGNLEQASHLVAQVQKKGFPDQLIRFQIQTAQSSLGKIEMHLRAFQKQYPNEVSLYLWWGKELAAGNLWAEAEKKLQQALRVAPKNGAVHFELSKIYEQKGDSSSASWYLEKAIELAPSSVEFQVFAAKKYQSRGDLKKATAALAPLDPNSPKALFLRGVVAREEGNYKEARNIFSQYAATFGSLEAEIALAELELIEKKPKLAQARLQGIVGLDSKRFALQSLEAKIVFTKAEIQLGRLKRAAQRLAPYTKTAKAEGRLQLVLAEVRAKQGKLKQAILVLQAGLKQFPEQPELVQAYSLYLGLAGRHREAIPLLEAMQKVESRYSKLFYYRLAEFYYLAGQKSAFKKLPLN